MLIKRIDELFNLKNVQEEARKHGSNLITAGLCAIFVANATSLSARVIVFSLCAIILGVASLSFGTLRSITNESE